MIQRGGGACFLLESAETIRVLRKGRRQHLDRDVAPQPRIVCSIDLAHATGAKRSEDGVGPEANTGGQGHEGPDSSWSSS